MASTHGPILKRNIIHSSKIKTVNDHSSRLSTTEDTRKRIPKLGTTDLLTLSGESLRALASVQNPQLRISIVRLVKNHKENASLVQGTGPFKKRLLLQRRCQVQLTIQHSGENAHSSSPTTLYSDHRHAIFKYAEALGTSSNNVELDTPFEIDKFKLLVPHKTNSTWKYEMAQLYQIKLTLRFLESADLHEFLLYIFEQDMTPSAQIHATFGVHFTTSLKSEARFEPFVYRSNTSNFDTGYDLLVVNQWYSTTKTSLQLAQSHAPRNDVNGSTGDVRFVLGDNDAQGFTCQDFGCVLCDRRAQGSMDALELHLRTCHTHLKFIRSSVADNGKVTIQFKVALAKPKPLVAEYLATPPESVNTPVTPPHDSESGVSSWVENGRWVASKDTGERSTLEATSKRKRNADSSSPHKVKTRPQSPQSLNSVPKSDRVLVGDNHRHPLDSAKTTTLPRKVGKSILMANLDTKGTAVNENKAVSSKKVGHVSDKDKIFVQLGEHERLTAVEPLSQGKKYVNFGPAAVAQMSRSHEGWPLNSNSGHEREPSNKPRQSVSTHRSSGTSSKINSTLPHTDGKTMAKHLSSPAPNHSGTQRIPQTKPIKQYSELDRGQKSLRAENSNVEHETTLIKSTDSWATKKIRSEQINLKSDLEQTANKGITENSTSMISPVHISSHRRTSDLTNAHVDQTTSNKNCSPSSSTARGLISAVEEATSHGFPVEIAISKPSVSPTFHRQSREHGQPSTTATTVRRESEKGETISSSAPTVRQALILRDAEAILRIAQEHAQTLPKPTRRKFRVPAVPAGVTLFRTSTKRALTEGEYVSESEDDIDESWAKPRHHETIDINRDATSTQKAFMKRWDAHFTEEQLSGNTHAAVALLRFTAANKEWLCSNDMQNQFSLKIATWYADKLMSWQDVRRCMALLKHQEKVMLSGRRAEDGGQRTALGEPPQIQENCTTAWLSTCSCGVPLSVAGMQKVVVCSNYSCKSPNYHMACVRLATRPESWLCSSCTKCSN